MRWATWCGFAPLPAVAPLPTRVEFGALIADRACAADVLRADLAARGAQAVVAPKANRTGAVECGREMYRWCHLAENFFCKPKRFQRVAARCGKTGSNYRSIHGVGACLVRVIVHRP